MRLKVLFIALFFHQLLIFNSRGAENSTVYTEWPFDAQEAKTRQEMTASELGVTVEKVVKIAGVDMEFVLIPAGEFMMGASKDEPQYRHETQHKVRITRPFYMAKYECTQAQWMAVTGSKNPSHFKKSGLNAPVEMISCESIDKVFLKRCQQYTPPGMVFALPTEAQWEYACRAGTATMFNWGSDEPDTNLANYDGIDNNLYDELNQKYPGEDRKKTLPVGSFPANNWGLFDMHGNVFEVCRDYYRARYYEKSPRNDPLNTKPSSLRVIRGGAWGSGAMYCRSACRAEETDYESMRWIVGFRLVLEFVPGKR